MTTDQEESLKSNIAWILMRYVQVCIVNQKKIKLSKYFRL